MSLRDYQTQAVSALREGFKGVYQPSIAEKILGKGERPVRSQLLQLATGAGKTPIVTAIVFASQKIAARFGRKTYVWFVVPRNELLDQASEHFKKWSQGKIAHSTIRAGVEESRAFEVHIVSKDTLLRRLDRVKNWPDILIFDEAHLYYHAQLAIIAKCPETTRIIGVTATPERLSGEGLWSGAGGPYDAMIQGPSIPWLTTHDFLAPMRYYAPPIEGFREDLKALGTVGGDYNKGSLDEVMERRKRKVYGSAVEAYREHGIRSDGSKKPALIFCHSVKAAYELTEEFQKFGLKFECIEGSKRDHASAVIKAMREGTVEGIVNCELATYGLDIPKIEYGASLRPTLSRALYFQMVGRILRVSPGKEEALFFDHANMVEDHQDLENPGSILFDIEDLKWNFEGFVRRKRNKDTEVPLRLCPYKGYEYCRDPRCGKSGCVLRDPSDTGRADLETIAEIKLEERKAPAKLADYPDEEKRAFQDQIGRLTDEAVTGLEAGQILPGPIGELLKLAEKLGRKPTWVYHFLQEAMAKKTGKPNRAINVPLLHEIRRIKNYAPGWVFFVKKQIEQGIKESVEM